MRSRTGANLTFVLDHDLVVADIERALIEGGLDVEAIFPATTHNTPIIFSVKRRKQQEGNDNEQNNSTTRQG